MVTFAQLEQLFKDSSLLTLALTHRSWINENAQQTTSNERLEFLGDAIVEFVVSSHLYSVFPDKVEGYLTNMRANLVNTTNLASIAAEMGVGNKLLLSKGEEVGGGRTNPSLLADSFEAIVGALFIDSGLEATTEFINNTVLATLDKMLTLPLKDAKSLLQEEVQAKGLAAPKYRVVSETGPDHNKTFTVEVVVDSQVAATGIGRSKSEAEQSAAKSALALPTSLPVQ